MKQNENPMAPETGLVDSEEPMYPVTVDGETMELTLEQLIAAAEQGLSRMNQQAQRDEMGGMPPVAGAENPEMMPEGDSEGYRRFQQAYPDVRPTEIPEQVWAQAGQTGDLLEAYRLHEIMQLRQEIADLRMNQKNRERDVGSARSDGESMITDPIILALMGKG